jgi:hypothetical protein
VEAAFMDRVRRLPEATRTVLLLAAVDDTGDPAALLAAARTLGAGAGAADLEPAERAGLVAFDRHAIAFHHPLVRSAVYQSASFARRQAAHLAVAYADSPVLAVIETVASLCLRHHARGRGGRPAPGRADRHHGGRGPRRGGAPWSPSTRHRSGPWAWGSSSSAS